MLHIKIAIPLALTPYPKLGLHNIQHGTMLYVAAIIYFFHSNLGKTALSLQ